MLMRGGTSKGAFFVADDLPHDPSARDDLLLRILGSPDPRQIDGLGGAHPLTSKVAIVGHSTDPAADVDYLFLQVVVDKPVVTDAQNCGNLLAGVGPFAVERGLVAVAGQTGVVRIRMLNSGGIAVARFPVAGGEPVYSGTTVIPGVPGTASEVRLDFASTEGATCGSLLPTGAVVDTIDGVDVTCIDNGMPVVVMRAADVGVSGYEPCAELEADGALRERIERIRLKAGPLMRLGDVTRLMVPKVTMVAPPQCGGHLCTRTFIPHRCHDAIGVLGAVSVATAALLPGTPVAALLGRPIDGGHVVVEHATGALDVSLDIDSTGARPTVRRSGIVRTARRLFDGVAYPRDC